MRDVPSAHLNTDQSVLHILKGVTVFHHENSSLLAYLLPRVSGFRYASGLHSPSHLLWLRGRKAFLAAGAIKSSIKQAGFNLIINPVQSPAVLPLGLKFHCAHALPSFRVPRCAQNVHINPGLEHASH
jgi:hypothetical protein